MPTDKITAAIGKGLDKIRQKLGPAGNLSLLKYSMASGDEVIAVVTSGWLPVLGRDGLRIEVIENAPLVGGTQLSAAQVFEASRLSVDGKEYEIPQDSVVRPLGEPRLWLIGAKEIRPVVTT